VEHPLLATVEGINRTGWSAIQDNEDIPLRSKHIKQQISSWVTGTGMDNQADNAFVIRSRKRVQNEEASLLNVDVRE